MGDYDKNQDQGGKPGQDEKPGFDKQQEQQEPGKDKQQGDDGGKPDQMK
jgi:hypothetical protein